MPRGPRLLVSGAILHVYCRFIRGKFESDENDEAAEFIEKPRDPDGLTAGATHEEARVGL